LAASALGAAAVGAVAIGALAIRSLAVKRGRIGRLAIGELEVGRLRVRESIIEGTRDGPHPFRVLEGHKYANLTTFRKGGEPVTTPVWFALVDGRVYVETGPESGKVKRMRNNPRVVLTPSTPWGAPRGESVEGVARIVDPNDAPGRARAALLAKYRPELVVARPFGALRGFGRPNLEIRAIDAETEA
jgi:PPOX class probable F420-dependent enzyme